MGNVEYAPVIVSEDKMSFMTSAEVEALVNQKVAEALLSLARAPRPFKVFGLNASQAYAKAVGDHLGVSLTPHKEETFEDGEPYVKPCNGLQGNVRGHNVFVVQSLYDEPSESVSDKLIKLVIMCGALRDASAHEIIAVIPHLAFARQDRKTESRAPITTKYIAKILQKAGVNRALFIDVHNLAAEQNSFDVPIDNLEAKLLQAEWCASALIAENKTANIKVMAPDSGGVSRAKRFRDALLKALSKKGSKLKDIGIVVFDKTRVSGTEVEGSSIIGDVKGAEVIAYDDMISTGGTMKKACGAVKKDGGNVFAIVATHGLFVGKANEVFDDLDAKLVVTDTVSPFRLNDKNKAKLHIVDTTKMMAEAIVRIHRGTGSISELL